MARQGRISRIARIFCRATLKAILVAAMTSGPALAATSLGAVAPHPDTALIRVFNLHDPTVEDSWEAFLDQTPMTDNQPLPPELRSKLKATVAFYRLSVPDGEPAFFVATYFNELHARLMPWTSSSHTDNSSQPSALPLRTCPVFMAGENAPVAELLSTLTGLPGLVFSATPGDADRYLFLFLQSEFSHCRLLRQLGDIAMNAPLANTSSTSRPVARIVIPRSNSRYEAAIHTATELRAVIETMGDLDAAMTYRERWPGDDAQTELDVLRSARLVAALTTDADDGYAAIPMIIAASDADSLEQEASGGLVRIDVGNAIARARYARSVFQQLVPGRIRNPADLLHAQALVASALQARDRGLPDDPEIRAVLRAFLTASAVLTGTYSQKEKWLLASASSHFPSRSSLITAE